MKNLFNPKNGMHGLFPMRASATTAVATAILSLLFLASCAPIAENERMSPLPPGYGRIIVDTGGGGSRAVTDADKQDSRKEVFFNGVSNGSRMHGTFKVGSTVNVVVRAYRNDGTNELIGQGTASHTMTYGTNSVTVTLGPVDGYYRVSYAYGDALLGGTYGGITADKNYYKGGEDEVTAPSDDDVTWQHGTLSGWKYNDENGGEQTVGAGQNWTFPMPSVNTTLTAQWTKKQYSLTYEYNIPSEAAQGASGSGKPDDTSPQDAFSKVSVGSETPTLTAQNQQWTFKYWTLTEADTGTHYSAGYEITLTGDTTLYAQWTSEAVWKVTFAEPQSNVPTSYTTAMPTNDVVQRGQPFRWTNPAATGWTFEGWTVNDAGATGSVPDLSATETSYTPQGDTTLTAKWTALYTVQYDANGETLLAGASLPANPSGTFTSTDSVSIQVPSQPGQLASGKIWAGWATTSSGNATYTSAQSVAISNLTANADASHVITLYAVWKDVVATVMSGGITTPYATFDAAWAAVDGKTATITLNKNASDVAVTLTSGTVTLDLNGKTLTGNGASTVITIRTGATFTLEDNSTAGSGTITGGLGNQKGGGVHNSGTFTMNGGTISGNNHTGANGGGGVFNDGMFTMSGGTISDNISSNMGGGVFGQGGTFTMSNGATISNNESSGHGGGVYVSSASGTFTMSGGTISDNEVTNSSSYGGGVYVDSGTFTMSGGVIENNTTAAGRGGGIYIMKLNANTTFEMSGDAKVTVSSSNNDIRLYTGATIIVNSALTGDTPVGKISLSSYTGTPTVLTGSAVGTNYSKFTLADAGYKINSTGQVETVYRDISTAKVGDVICANGKVVSANDITTELQNKTIAVVYKVDTTNKKAWAVGKMLSANQMAWSLYNSGSSPDASNKNITGLQEESGYIDGSTGLGIFRSAVNDATTDDQLKTNYPAWDYACNYGTNQATSADIPNEMQSGWYLPSINELLEVYNNKTAVDLALTQIGVPTFIGYYWTSTQYASDDTYCCYVWFSASSASTAKAYNSKEIGSNVCAVRQFTW